MIKLVFMLKRKPGMTREAFIERYERCHAPLGEQYAPEAARYVRRYLQPLPDLFTGLVDEPDYDVITELWFDDEETMNASMARLAQPEVVALISADEDEMFDRSKNRVFMVDERDSPKPGRNWR